MLTKSKMIDRSSKIKNRLFECLENGELTLGDELEIIEYMVNRVNPLTPAEYARREGISRAGAKKRIESGKEAYFTIAGQVFVI
jgi:hypothetical protein